MKGYKGMDANMQCLGIQYEVGKSYHVDGEIRCCRNGLHFCGNLKDVFRYYPRESGNRFFEVEASGIIDEKKDKWAASDLRIVRELTSVEINRIFYTKGMGLGYSYKLPPICFGGGNGYGDCFGNGVGCGYYWNGFRGNGFGDGANHRTNDGNGVGYSVLDLNGILLFI